MRAEIKNFDEAPFAQKSGTFERLSAGPDSTRSGVRRAAVDVAVGGVGRNSRRTRSATFARECRRVALSLLRQPRLTQRVERRLQNRFAPDQPFDAELGIEAASFGEGGLRLIYVAFQRVGGGEI